MSVNLTEVAANEVKRVMEEQNMNVADYGLKVSVANGGGCSGYIYGLNFEKKENINSEDFSQNEQHSIVIFVDKKSDSFLEGTTIDFYHDVEKRGFTFDNPNNVKSCGGCSCGSK
jgi:iron-sulfur cluster assembly protein